MNLSEWKILKKHNRKEDCVERERYNTEPTGRSQGDMHVVVAAEGFAAVRALAGTRGETLLNTIFAEDVTACLDRRVLEVGSAYCAQCQ